MEVFTGFLLALAMSLDGLGVGMSYGLRSITLPFSSLCIISLISIFLVTVSMSVGDLIGILFPAGLVEKTGPFVLIFLGLGICLQSLFFTKGDQDCQVTLKNPETEEKKGIIAFLLKIMQEPGRADVDDSGVISPKEAMVLGFALATDALAFGLGAGIAGYRSWFIPVLAGVFQPLFITWGRGIGFLLGKRYVGSKGFLLPGLILVILGLLRIR